MRHVHAGVMILILSGLMPTAARADTTFAVEPLLQINGSRSPDPSVEGWFMRSFEGSPFGVSGFWWVMKDWAEIHLGPTWTPVEGLTLGVDVGIEQNGDAGLRLRYATSVWFSRDGWTANGSMEFANDLFIGDASVIWYDVLVAYQVHDRLTLGARTRREIGAGPFVQLHVPELHAKLWTTWAPIHFEHITEPNPGNALLGLTIEL